MMLLQDATSTEPLAFKQTANQISGTKRMSNANPKVYFDKNLSQGNCAFAVYPQRWSDIYDHTTNNTINSMYSVQVVA